MSASSFDQVQIAVDQQSFLGVICGCFQQDTVRIADERVSPEFDIVFHSYSIGRDNEDPVGDCVGTHHGLPGVQLAGSKRFLFFRLPSDRGGINQDLCSRQRRQPRGFGEPLIPTDADANLAQRSWNRLKAFVTGREVKFFVEEGVIRDVHLSVDAREAAVGIKHDRRVMKQARRTSLEKTADNDDFVLGSCFEKVPWWSDQELTPLT